VGVLGALAGAIGSFFALVLGGVAVLCVAASVLLAFFVPVAAGATAFGPWGIILGMCVPAICLVAAFGLDARF
jgi:hypothetical protein